MTFNLIYFFCYTHYSSHYFIEGCFFYRLHSLYCEASPSSFHLAYASPFVIQVIQGQGKRQSRLPWFESYKKLWIKLNSSSTSLIIALIKLSKSLKSVSFFFLPFIAYMFRITPAYAGKSLANHPPLHLQRDHPRIRGKKCLFRH